MNRASAAATLKYLDTAKPARTYREAAKRRKLADECRAVVRPKPHQWTDAELRALPF